MNKASKCFQGVWLICSENSLFQALLDSLFYRWYLKHVSKRGIAQITIEYENYQCLVYVYSDPWKIIAIYCPLRKCNA